MPEPNDETVPESLIETMRKWQGIENASIESADEIIDTADNPLLRMVMEIVQSDSRMHARVQDLIATGLHRKSPPPDAARREAIRAQLRRHVDMEKKMVGLVRDTLGEVEGKGMVVEEFFLRYLLRDEEKHDALLDEFDELLGS